MLCIEMLIMTGWRWYTYSSQLPQTKQLMGSGFQRHRDNTIFGQSLPGLEGQSSTLRFVRRHANEIWRSILFRA